MLNSHVSCAGRKPVHFIPLGCGPSIAHMLNKWRVPFVSSLGFAGSPTAILFAVISIYVFALNCEPRGPRRNHVAVKGLKGGLPWLHNFYSATSISGIICVIGVITPLLHPVPVIVDSVLREAMGSLCVPDYLAGEASARKDFAPSSHNSILSYQARGSALALISPDLLLLRIPSRKFDYGYEPKFCAG